MAADETGKELQRAAVMFPRLFVWIIGVLMSALTLLGGAAVKGIYSGAEENRLELGAHKMTVNDHEVRIRVIETGLLNLNQKVSETNLDVKDIRKLLEESLRARGGLRGP